MKNLLLETSALLKWFLKEEGHDNIQSLINNKNAALQFYITEITIAETLNVLKNRLGKDERDRILYVFTSWLQPCIFILHNKNDWF